MSGPAIAELTAPNTGEAVSFQSCWSGRLVAEQRPGRAGQISARLSRSPIDQVDHGLVVGCVMTAAEVRPEMAVDQQMVASVHDRTAQRDGVVVTFKPNFVYAHQQGTVAARQKRNSDILFERQVVGRGRSRRGLLVREASETNRCIEVDLVTGLELDRSVVGFGRTRGRHQRGTYQSETQRRRNYAPMTVHYTLSLVVFRHVPVAVSRRHLATVSDTGIVGKGCRA
jgi:hypothetical protein